MKIGRFELFVHPGAWRRFDEWVFERQECDEGCIIFDIAFMYLTWQRGKHIDKEN